MPGLFCELAFYISKCFDLVSHKCNLVRVVFNAGGNGRFITKSGPKSAIYVSRP